MLHYISSTNHLEKRHDQQIRRTGLEHLWHGVSRGRQRTDDPALPIPALYWQVIQPCSAVTGRYLNITNKETNMTIQISLCADLYDHLSGAVSRHIAFYTTSKKAALCWIDRNLPQSSIAKKPYVLIGGQRHTIEEFLNSEA